MFHLTSCVSIRKGRTRKRARVRSFCFPSQFHDELRQEMRVVVLHVERREFHGSIAVRDGHDFDDLQRNKRWNKSDYNVIKMSNPFLISLINGHFLQVL